MDLSNDFWFSFVFLPFLINLATTAISIVFTVFWIDRKIQEREEKQWLPSQHFIYSKLMVIAGRGLLHTLPTRFLKPSDNLYHFGEVGSSPRYEGIKEVEGSTLYDEWRMELRIFTKKEIRNKMDRLIDILSEINEILAQSAYLLKPDILHLILYVREKLEDIEFSRKFLSEDDNENEIEEPDNLILTHQLITLVAAFENIMDWLSRKANKKESWKELEKVIFGNANQQTSS